MGQTIPWLSRLWMSSSGGGYSLAKNNEMSIGIFKIGCVDWHVIRWFSWCLVGFNIHRFIVNT